MPRCLSQKEINIGCPDLQRLPFKAAYYFPKSDRTWLERRLKRRTNKTH